jgi:hypothetical protein
MLVNNLTNQNNTSNSSFSTFITACIHIRLSQKHYWIMIHKILHKPTVYTTWSITKSMSGQNQANIVIQCWSAWTGLLTLSLSSIDPDWKPTSLQKITDGAGVFCLDEVLLMAGSGNYRNLTMNTLITKNSLMYDLLQAQCVHGRWTDQDGTTFM